MQPGNNRQAHYFHNNDYSDYREYLREALVMNGRKLYAFVLMTNHAHLLASGEVRGAIPGLMRSVGRRHGRDVNATYRRSGTLFKATLMESERYPHHMHARHRA